MIDLRDIVVDEKKNADTRQALQNSAGLWPACVAGTVMTSTAPACGLFLTAVSRGSILDISWDMLAQRFFTGHILLS